MQSYQTPRFKLPLLAIGQAQKELFHNEALILLDFLTCPSVLAIHDDPATLMPSDGQAWLIDLNPIGEWSLRANQIAIWTPGGWRFIEPAGYTELFVSDANEIAVFRNNTWVFHGTISEPGGGEIVDMEARLAIDSILDALRMKAVIGS
ncbi:MAG: hypothetical protein Pars2KO_24390 [Parasphingorhabdus sp.]